MPLTKNKPKALVSVKGRPMIEYIMDDVLGYTDEFVIICGYEGKQIVDHIGWEYKGTDVRYAAQDQQLGLAHAIRQAEPYIDDTFAVALADSFHFGEVHEVFEMESDGAVLLEEVPMDEASRYGIAEVNYGIVTDLTEKPDEPTSNLALTGLGIFPPEFMTVAHVIQPSDRGEYEWTDVINLLVRAGFRIEAHTMDSERVDVGYPEDIEEVERLLG